MSRCRKCRDLRALGAKKNCESWVPSQKNRISSTARTTSFWSPPSWALITSMADAILANTFYFLMFNEYFAGVCLDIASCSQRGGKEQVEITKYLKGYQRPCFKGGAQAHWHQVGLKPAGGRPQARQAASPALSRISWLNKVGLLKQ